VRWRPDKCFLIVERSSEQADQAVEAPLTSRCSAVRTKSVCPELAGQKFCVRKSSGHPRGL